MRFLGVMCVFCVLWAVAGPAVAGPAAADQACGPVVRVLEGDYFLVQCNGTVMQANDKVSIRRQGQEVARGTVMRTEGNLCSVLVPGGAAQRMDVVYLLSPPGDPARGPAIPAFGTGQRAVVPSAASMSSSASPASTAAPASAARSKRDSFFSSVGGGRVLNLNTGEMINEH